MRAWTGWMLLGGALLAGTYASTTALADRGGEASGASTV